MSRFCPDCGLQFNTNTCEYCKIRSSLNEVEQEIKIAIAEKSGSEKVNDRDKEAEELEKRFEWKKDLIEESAALHKEGIGWLKFYIVTISFMVGFETLIYNFSKTCTLPRWGVHLLFVLSLIGVVLLKILACCKMCGLKGKHQSLKKRNDLIVRSYIYGFGVRNPDSTSVDIVALNNSYLFESYKERINEKVTIPWFVCWLVMGIGFVCFFAFAVLGTFYYDLLDSCPSNSTTIHTPNKVSSAILSDLHGSDFVNAFEMKGPTMFINEEISAEFRESVLVRVGIMGILFLKTEPLRTARGKETEFSFRVDNTSGVQTLVRQNYGVSSLGDGLFHVRIAASEEPIPLLKYSLLPDLTPLPLKVGLIKRHSGTLLSVIIQYSSTPHLPVPLNDVTFVLKVAVDISMLEVSPKAVLNGSDKEHLLN